MGWLEVAIMVSSKGTWLGDGMGRIAEVIVRLSFLPFVLKSGKYYFIGYI